MSGTASSPPFTSGSSGLSSPALIETSPSSNSSTSSSFVSSSSSSLSSASSSSSSSSTSEPDSPPPPTTARQAPAPAVSSTSPSQTQPKKRRDLSDLQATFHFVHVFMPVSDREYLSIKTGFKMELCDNGDAIVTFEGPENCECRSRLPLFYLHLCTTVTNMLSYSGLFQRKVDCQADS